MKYDDASWHYGGKFPADLPPDAGATHIGMFVSWCLLNDLGGELHTIESRDDLERLRNGEETPGQWFIRNCDEKFTDEDLNEQGNAFALVYFRGDEESSPFLADYARTFPEYPDLYPVPDTWVNFDRLAPLINKAFTKWRGDKRPFWARLFS